MEGKAVANEGENLSGVASSHNSQMAWAARGGQFAFCRAQEHENDRGSAR